MDKLKGVFPTLLSAFTALVLGLSVTYDWAYFFAIDLKLFGSMSIGDHLVSGMTVLPMVLFFLFAARIVDFEGMRIKLLPLNQRSTSGKWEWLKGVIAVLFLSAIASLFGGWVLALIVFFSFSFVRSVSNRIANSDWSALPEVDFAIVRLIFVWVSVAVFGYYMGLSDVSSEPDYQLRIKGSSELMDVKVLRINERSFLVHSDGATKLLRRELVEELIILKKWDQKEMPSLCWYTREKDNCQRYWE